MTKTTDRSKTRVAWREVLRAAQNPEERSSLSCALRAAGFTPDHIEQKPEARRVLVETLVSLEDRLELSGRGKAWEEQRRRIRDMRRNLECEVWT